MVDNGLRPLKPGQTCLSVPVCATSSKSTVVERDAADVHAQTNCSCVVSEYGSKTCKHMSQGGSFTSNVTKRSCEVISSNTSMTCTSDNVVYLISCNRCGVQNVGETS